MMKFKTGLVFTSFLLIFGCATPKKAELGSSNPQQVVRDIEDLKSDLIESNADVLAKDSYEKGNDDLNEALENLKDKESRKEIMSNLAQAKAHYLEAQKAAKARKVVPKSIMNARKNAIDTKLFSSQFLKVKLDDIDDSLRDETETFTEALSANELSLFQAKYLNLEVEAVQNTSLGAFRRIIKKAKGNNAEDLAPKTLKDARSRVKIAENLINQSPRNSSQYEKSVESANKSAKLLDDVMNQLNGEAKGSSESIALKLVYQGRKLGRLSDKVGSLQGSLVTRNSKIGLMSQELADKKSQILSSKNKIRFQNAMNQVRTSFSENEASVYQQGEKLIIRLKEISFKPGSATIPTNSMTLLSKVNSIVAELNPREVMIEGHTDSTGPQDSNMLLSNKRAKAVKQYFSSLDASYRIDARGFGESKPIANNQTKQGRFLNRRVDIVVKADQ
ncbi:OmpA family protein [bacterium]|nr:OmpA family protein [bacterium]